MCIIFSSNNFIDHTYRTINSLPVYKIYDIRVFAFKIVHDDACHPIHVDGGEGEILSVVNGWSLND